MKRKLTVLQVAFPFAPVGPGSVGGSEQVVKHLDRALTRAGHRSLVMACRGSHVSGTLIETSLPVGEITDEVRARIWNECRSTLDSLIQREGVDVVHLHGLDFDRYLPRSGIPVLATLHLPPQWYSPEVFRISRPATFLNCVSRTQAQQCPGPVQPSWVIENGVDVKEFATVERKTRGFALSLGRICPEKGYHHGIEAAKLANSPFVLAGAVFGYPDHVRYFEQEISPRLDRKRRFIGPAGFERKRTLLSSARCVLIPSTAPETSSLVAMEALACGTPVIAFPSGALPEIVEPGLTGFLVRDSREMAEAILRSAEIDPAECREVARARFCSDRMAGRYIEAYHRIAGCR